MLNLHFMNPFLKSNTCIYTQRLLIRNLEYNSEEDNNRFIHKVTEYLAEFKKKLFE